MVITNRHFSGPFEFIITWVLGVKWNVPNYRIQEEVDEELIWVRSWGRAYKYEKKLREEDKGTWTHVYAKWRNEEAQKGLRWRTEKKELELGISEEGIWDREERGWDVVEEMERRMRDRRGDQNREKMENSKFNPAYRELKLGQGRAQYLNSREMGHKDKMRLARYRTGGEVGAAQYWKGKEDRMCRVCIEEEETLQHVIEQCRAI